jgi:hypothetical protein
LSKLEVTSEDLMLINMNLKERRIGKVKKKIRVVIILFDNETREVLFIAIMHILDGGVQEDRAIVMGLEQ